jgi:hypothetical protein
VRGASTRPATANLLSAKNLHAVRGFTQLHSTSEHVFRSQNLFYIALGCYAKFPVERRPQNLISCRYGRTAFSSSNIVLSRKVRPDEGFMMRLKHCPVRPMQQ